MIYSIDANLLKFCPSCGKKFADYKLKDIQEGILVVCGHCGGLFGGDQDIALRILANWLRGKEGRFLRVSKRRLITADKTGGFAFLMHDKEGYLCEYKAVYPNLALAIIAAQQYGISFKPKEKVDANEP